MSVRVHSRPKWESWAVAGLLRLIGATLRYRFHDDSGILGQASTGPLIFAVWHNRLALSMEIYGRYARQGRPVEGLAALVSASKDGALLADVLARFGVRAARGSTSRRGPQALLELTSLIAAGFDLAITPDGPRGPCYTLQEGVISLAQVTGRPIIPVSTYCRRKFSLRSWDRFQIPCPGTRAEIYFGAPLSVPRAATEEERGELRTELKRRMDALTRD